MVKVGSTKAGSDTSTMPSLKNLQNTIPDKVVCTSIASVRLKRLKRKLKVLKIILILESFVISGD